MLIGKKLKFVIVILLTVALFKLTALPYALNWLSGKCYVSSNETYLPPANNMENWYFDIYLINTNMTSEHIEKEIPTVNKIWNPYGKNFTIEKVAFDLSKTDIGLDNFENPISGLDKEKINKELEKHYNFSDVKSGRIIVIFADIKNPNIVNDFNKDFGLDLNNRKIIVAANSKNVSWTTAHEIGHVMNLFDKNPFYGEINLMTNAGCIRDEFYPTNLNKEQFDSLSKLDK